MGESEESLTGPPEFPSDSGYTIEMVARITHIPAEEIVIYYRSGIVSPIRTEDAARLIFDEEAIRQLRQINFLLSEYRINREGLQMVASLLGEVERLRQEVRFLRER